MLNKIQKIPVSFLIMLICIFCFTIGQYVPVYFVSPNYRMYFYFVLLTLTILSTVFSVFNFFYKRKRKNVGNAVFFSTLSGLGILVFFGIWTIALLLGFWTEATTYYVKRNNAKVKIISRYVNEGAWGGGTAPTDYQIVLNRPFLFFFKIETQIDTSKINRSEWVSRKE